MKDALALCLVLGAIVLTGALLFLGGYGALWLIRDGGAAFSGLGGYATERVFALLVIASAGLVALIPD
jgi:hypothetical protein